MSDRTKEIVERMIKMGYSDEGIVLRLRHPIELVQAIREHMRLEEIKKLSEE